MDGKDTCCCVQHKPFESAPASKVNLDDSGHPSDSISSNKPSAEDRSHLCNGLGELTISEEIVNDVDCIGCSVPSIGDGPMPEFNIPTGVLQSVTCFVAAL